MAVRSIDQPWRKVYVMLEEALPGIAPNVVRYVSWEHYEHVTGLEKDKSRAAYKRALQELERVYGIGLVAQNALGFVIGRMP